MWHRHGDVRLAVVLVWVYTRAARGWAILLLLLPVACLLSRLYEGAHHLSDVLTSVPYAAVWIAIVAGLVLSGTRARDSEDAPATVPARAGLVRASPAHGTGRALTRNPISEAIELIASTTGQVVVLLSRCRRGGGGRARGARVREGDAVVLCDPYAPAAPAALRSRWSRRRRRDDGPSRAARFLAELFDEGVAGLDKLHVPAGLETGGKAPGEIALSVVAEIVATAYGRRGGPMRA